ncbi:transcriptional regulator with XRE-family HTH domain [Algoriphagus sp. 4150]|uniref:helix-turn-helix domain-containing protein n=1 Tax=Algoriphagus sp. 4150 TaxID=2817756 RepID=UPI002867A495|nr:helix-turn-helix transcriptional regulator [Algoriphagus sp. 4150]MDR7128066.1 transcriptional regulator with XRE-family HTH domain [Algoriphagus sp. 4150]
MTLPEKIINARRTRGLTQEELAQKAQLSIRTVQRIENGQSIPRMFTLRAIADALDLAYSEIDTKSREKVQNPMNQSEVSHFLRILCLSCFSYLVIPYVHFMVAQYLLRKEKRLNGAALSFARYIIRTQIWWVVLFHLGLLVTLAMNFFLVNYSSGVIIVNYFWIVFVAYIFNLIIVSGNFFRIKAVISFKTAI